MGTFPKNLAIFSLIGAVGLFAKAWTGLRSPREVRVVSDFIEIAAAGAVRRWNWERIASVETGTGLMGIGSLLVIRDSDNRVIARMSGFDDMATLKKLIAERIAQHPTRRKRPLGKSSFAEPRCCSSSAASSC